MRSFLSVLSILAAFTVVSVSGQEAAPDPACVDTCDNEVRSKFTEYGCTDAAQAGCLCKVEGFRSSVRDCAVARCTGTTEAQVGNWLDTNFCVGIALDGAVSSSSTAAEPAASTTAAAEQPTTTSAEVAETTTAAPTTEPTSTAATETTAAASTPAAPEETPVTTETSAAEETTQAAKTSTAETSETTAADNDDGAAAAAGGLSQGAAVGIGVGVTVVVIAVAAIAIAILLRKRKQKQNQRTGGGRSHDISRPIADVGRGYGSGDHGSYMEKRGESFEMTAHRYEDMVPRQVPRTMV